MSESSRKSPFPREPNKIAVSTLGKWRKCQPIFLIIVSVKPKSIVFTYINCREEIAVCEITKVRSIKKTFLKTTALFILRITLKFTEVRRAFFIEGIATFLPFFRHVEQHGSVAGQFLKTGLTVAVGI